jgi:hypothetical protein
MNLGIIVGIPGFLDSELQFALTDEGSKLCSVSVIRLGVLDLCTAP